MGQALITWVGASFLVRYDWKTFFLVTGLIPLVWLFPWNKFLSKWETSRTSASILGMRDRPPKSIRLRQAGGGCAEPER